MRIALAQTNPIVGDIPHNCKQIVDFAQRAKTQGAEVVVFPELTIPGYPPKDLLLKPQFIDDNLRALGIVANHVKGIDAIVGYADRNPEPVGRPLRNSVALLRDGVVLSRHYKTLLPTYDVFDESRYFEPGPADGRCNLVQLGQVGVPLIYVNQVGGNDELVFDGNSLVMDGSGKVVGQARDFEEDLLVVDVGEDAVTQGGRVEHHSRDVESIYRALVLGLRDYVRKCGFKKVVLGLSGGIDSALVCALAAAALGPENVTGVAMPSRFSSDHSIADAKQLAANLGVRFQIVPIEPAHIAYEHMLAAAFAGMKPDLTEENVQARIRGATLMAFSNKFGSLLLTTGNKSEIATGYCTLYGDMCGGLAVISDVPKMVVYQLAEFVNQKAGHDLIPRNSITKPPSAELRPNQTDQDSLPPYDVLDAILFRYVEEEKGAPQIIADGFDPATVMRVIRLIDLSEYKRRQAAPGIKVTSRAFGFGRRMPIAQNYRQPVPSVGQTVDALAELLKN